MIPAAADAGSKLRVGLLLDSYRQPAWTFEILSQIRRSAFAEIVLIVENGAAPAPRGLLERLRGLRTENLLYNVYARLDRRLVGGGESTAFSEHDAAPLLRGCPRLRVVPRQGRFSDELEEADLGRVREAGLDVLLRFGFRILKGGILTAARHGVWSYHHDDNGVVRGGPAGFFEVMRGLPTSGCILQVLGEDLDNGRVIDRAVLRTEASVRRNQERVFWRSAAMMPRRLEELWRTGRVKDAPAADPPRPNFYDQPMYTVPRNGEMAGYLARLLYRALQRRAERYLEVREWQVGYRLGPEAAPGALSFHRFRYLEPPPGVYWADPFTITRGGRHYVFVEEYLLERGQGRLAVVEIDEAGRPGPSRVVMEGEEHLSYPFVFERGGELYMLPETHRRRTIELYRCTRFPDEWRRERVLLRDVEAVDPTLHEEGGRLYLFFAARRGGGDFDDLHIYHAAELHEEFQPISGDPVKSDVRSSRPAGRLFRDGGRLYRPAQVGAPYYGRAMALCEVLRLDPGGYAERVVGTIEPGWRPDIVGTHTLGHGEGITVVDVLQRSGRLRKSLLRLRGGAPALPGRLRRRTSTPPKDAPRDAPPDQSGGTPRKGKSLETLAEKPTPSVTPE